MMIRRVPLLVVACLLSVAVGAADEADPAKTYAGLTIRDIGPAVTSGRITDFAFVPGQYRVYYAATASGGLWKTVNAGITWDPIFDGEDSYSIGVVELDPRNPNVVWVGTGENNSQRSVAYGDGVYKSLDGGKSWENVGLEESEHIGMIAIDPRDSDVVYVAAQGPLWRAGGDRGLYKSRDGGKNWERVLHVDEHTGANEVLIHPEHPDTLLVSTYQRRRHVWTLINGGPGSGVHRSTDGGQNWQEITSGLPPHEMGRIGLAYAPSKPDTVYALVETEDEHQGTYRSTDFGVTWEKRSDYVAGSPQYYNELVVDPHNPDRVYSMDTFMHVSEDGGKNWSRVGYEHKHVDEHALWIDPDDTDHLIAGNDGGIYESWDRGANWRHVRNLPITQFYRATPDNDEPFYNVYGGTQDNSSLGAPSRTTFNYGIANHDWVITLGGDGFKTQIDPTNPDTVYSQLQYGMLARYDRQSRERVLITPMPPAGVNDYKWNWNSAFIISPHDPKRVYFAGEKVLRSDDGGNRWRVVCPDLTRGLDRNEMEVLGGVWSVDGVAKNDSTSIYGSIISLSESPLEEGLLYVGTDDGLIQVSEDGGESWQRHDGFGDVPDMSYVSDVEASLHDVNVVFATFDNHKRGDFRPYVFRSDDRGRKWRSISSDLPERGSAHTIVQDHDDPNLLFVGTEFGVFFTQNGGRNWIELTGGMPTIAVRDLEIQRRENDLVIGTFGRGIRILDDYRALRTAHADLGDREATLFQVRDPWLYVEADVWGYGTKGFQGVTYFTAPNPPYGAVFTYYLRDGYKSLKDARRETERERLKSGEDNPYPTWEDLRAEQRQDAPEIWFVVTDSDGAVVRRVKGETKAGFHRTAWDLRRTPPDPVSLESAGPTAPWDEPPAGPLVAPGTYQVQMVRRSGDQFAELGEPQSFTVKELDRGQFRPDSLDAFAEELAAAADVMRAVEGARRSLAEQQNRVAHLKVALRDTPSASAAEHRRLAAIENALDEVDLALNGDQAVSGANEPTPLSLAGRVGRFGWAHWNALAAITDNQRESLDIARQQLDTVLEDLAESAGEIDAFQEALAGEAPWTPGTVPER
ncbi:MAG: hypothetical protein R3200_15510 [Xanthomonadales bacterium]|nr:hypothetical protein [Xanthomonadales bacterium]